MVRKEIFRVTIGLLVISAHAICFLIIFFGKSEYLTSEQQLSMGLLFMPITSAYIVAIIRSAVDRAAEKTDRAQVNLNYCLVIALFTLITLGGLIATVFNLQGAQESDRQRILLFEIAFGAGFGLIAADLFGKVERISIPQGRSSADLSDRT